MGQAIKERTSSSYVPCLRLTVWAGLATTNKLLKDRSPIMCQASSDLVTDNTASSSKKRTSSSYVPCLQLRLTVWTGLATTNILPEDVLLLIFYFDGLESSDQMRRLFWSWSRLVHVCRRWRSIILASPNFLDLTLVIGPRTRMELMDVWPPFPVIIRDTEDWPMPEDYDFDAAFAHRNRVCEIDIHRLTSSKLQQLASAMAVQFPALIDLELSLARESHPVQVLSNAFLGGSAPRLQHLRLDSIPFPTLPKFLLTAIGLVDLFLWDIPHSGYFSPEAIVAGLAVLTKLESLTIRFKSPLSRPDRERRRPPLPKRVALSALTNFGFQGVSEYLEDLVAWIDAPLLDSIWITFFHQLIFDIPQFAQFMRRTRCFEALNEAHVDFGYSGVEVESLPPTPIVPRKFSLRIPCKELDWQLSSLAQVFTSFSHSVYMVEHLYIYGDGRYFPSKWEDDIENMQWLELFHSCTAVKNIYVCKELEPSIASALQELVGERVTDMLPALESFFSERHIPGPEAKQFAATRQLLGHHVTISHWTWRREWAFS